jgi:uncharacterized membrane protein YphA (DoxX/SURF4 family)
VLRVAAGLSMISQGRVFLVGVDHTMTAAGLLMIIIGALLLMGFLTPVIGTLAGMGILSISLSWLPASTQNVFDSRPSQMLAVAMTIAIVFLGPGAFSLDAYLFGRRELIIPPSSRPPK